MSSSARNAYIDTLRGVAIFGVVIIHFGGSFANPGNAWTSSFYLGLVFGQVFNFAVPLFVFLSGLLAGPGTEKPEFTLWGYYRGRFVRIVLPYLTASLASFFLLNHVHEWREQPDFAAQIVWLAQKLFYFGVEPTLYFIPLILQLYLVQPLLKNLPRWVDALTGRRIGVAAVTLGLAIVLLAVHVALGVLCYRNVLSYYVWCRPCSLFWSVYFFCGLHFRVLSSSFSRRGIAIFAGIALIVIGVTLIADFSHLTDRQAVGASFELNNMDYAYSRPQLLIYDLACVGLLSIGITLGWAWRPTLISFIGRYTLEIYLWHILLLYEGAWRFSSVLESCRRMPEVIVFIAVAACLLIASIKHYGTTLIALTRQYRLVLVRIPS